MLVSGCSGACPGDGNVAGIFQARTTVASCGLAAFSAASLVFRAAIHSRSGRLPASVSVMT
jgi:hypothetical protein